MADFPYDESIPGETRLAFKYFELYRDQTGNRSIRKLCGLTVDGKKRLRTVIGRWSEASHWQERVKAFDSDQQRERAKAARKRRKADIDEFLVTEDAINKRSQRLMIMIMDELLKTGDTVINVNKFRMAAMAHSAMREHSKEILGFLDENADFIGQSGPED